MVKKFLRIGKAKELRTSNRSSKHHLPRCAWFTFLARHSFYPITPVQLWTKTRWSSEGIARNWNFSMCAIKCVECIAHQEREHTWKQQTNSSWLALEIKIFSPCCIFIENSLNWESNQESINTAYKHACNKNKYNKKASLGHKLWPQLRGQSRNTNFWSNKSIFCSRNSRKQSKKSVQLWAVQCEHIVTLHIFAHTVSWLVSDFTKMHWGRRTKEGNLSTF